MLVEFRRRISTVVCARQSVVSGHRSGLGIVKTHVRDGALQAPTKRLVPSTGQWLVT